MSDEAVYKLIVIGDSGVGKSNLTLRYSDDVFFADGAPTIGVDFKYARCAVDLSANGEESSGEGEEVATTSSSAATSSSPSSSPLARRQIGVRLQIWDTAGAEGFAVLTAAFYRSCHGIMLCFDLTNRSSFEHLDRWYSRVTEYAGPKIPPLVVVGCKLDLVRPTVSDGNRSVEAKPLSSSIDEFNVRSPEPQAHPGSTGLMLRGATHSMRQVDVSEAEEWARSHGAVLYLETSAKANVNVDWAFRYLATAVVRQALSTQPPVPRNTNGNEEGVGANSSSGLPHRTRPPQSLRRDPSREADSTAQSGMRRRRCC